MPIIRWLSLILVLWCGAAQAQTSPLGSGYSFANGQLYLGTTSILNAVKPPFAYSYNIVVPGVTGSSHNYFINTDQTGGAVGFNSQINQVETSDTYRFQQIISPGFGSNNVCSNGPLCWRSPFVANGDRHHVCVRWTPTQGYFYLDGIIRDQSPRSITYTPSSTPYWTFGQNVPTTNNIYDLRVYSSDIGAAGCVYLADLAAQGLYPTSGSYTTGMALHLPFDNCTVSGGTYTCNDTSGNGNFAQNINGAVGVAITSPAAGMVSGTVNVQATCTIGALACATVCYYMDGVLISSTCPTSLVSNYTYAWNTTTAVDGSHTLTAIGIAPGGATATSAPIAVTLSNLVTATTYYFNSSTGSDANNCKSSGAACQTTTKFQTLTLKGGDTVNFVGTGFSAANTLLSLCGPGATASPCSGGYQNFYPSSGTLTIQGPNTCVPLSGSHSAPPTNCATITRTGGDGSSPGILVWNGTNVVVQNFAIVGNQNTTAGAVGLDNEATNLPIGQSSNVTFQNNYVSNWNYGAAANKVAGFTFTNAQNFGPITNWQVLDNYITASYGVNPSPDGGVVLFGHAQGLVQGNVQEDAGGHSDAQGNGLQVQNWPSPNGGSVRTNFQFNVTHDNGGNYLTSEGGPYSLYSIGGDYTTFQFNEQYNQQCWLPGGFPTCMASAGGPDNGGADMDAGSTHILMQYNYLHANIMPGSNAMLFFIGSRGSCCGGNPDWGDNYYRYNIAENYFQGMDLNSGNSSGAVIISGIAFYNNTLSSNISNATANTLGYTGTCIVSPNNVFNNLCINTATSGWQYYIQQYAPFCSFVDYNDFYSPTHQDYWVTSNNTIYAAAGNLNGSPTNGGFAGWVTGCSAGAHNLNVNPGLAGTPGTGGTCWPGGTTVPAGPTQPPSAANCPAVYQLTHGSPLIGTGRSVNSTPTPAPTVDYYGNAVPNGSGSGYNIGAYGGAP